MLIDTINYGSWDVTVAGNPYEKDTIDTIRINNQDMSAEQTLTQFIRQSVTESPARHYAIIFQGHGSGWYLIPAEETNVSEILRFMADSFITRNNADETADPADISVLATSGTEEMAAFLARHEAAFESVEHLFDQTYAIDQTLKYYQLQDLYSLTEAAFGDDSAEMNEFKGLFNNIVLYYQQTQKKQEQPYASTHHGLSIVVNGAIDGYDLNGEAYSELSFPVILNTSDVADMAPGKQ